MCLFPPSMAISFWPLQIWAMSLRQATWWKDTIAWKRLRTNMQVANMASISTVNTCLLGSQHKQSSAAYHALQKIHWSGGSEGEERPRREMPRLGSPQELKVRSRSLSLHSHVLRARPTAQLLRCEQSTPGWGINFAEETTVTPYQKTPDFYRRTLLA